MRRYWRKNKNVKMRLRNKGQSGAVIGLLVVVVMMMIGVVIMHNLDSSFAASFTGGTYAPVYGNLSANNVTGFDLMSLAPLILGASILLGIVYTFAAGR